MSGADFLAAAGPADAPAPVADRVRAILIDVLALTDKEPGAPGAGVALADAARLTEDLGADSLDWLSIASDFEDAFDLSCNDLIDGPQPVTVADCVALVRSKTGEK